MTFGKVAIGVALATFGLLYPVSYNPAVGIGVNTACADVGCCVEIGSICGVLQHYKPHEYATLQGACV